MASSSNISNIRLQPRMCNCGRTAAIHIVRTNENGNEGHLFFVCPSKYSTTPTPHCNYFKFVAEDDEDVTSTIRSNTRACDAITVEDFNDVRTRLDDLQNDHGRRLERIENNIKAMLLKPKPCSQLLNQNEFITMHNGRKIANAQVDPTGFSYHDGILQHYAYYVIHMLRSPNPRSNQQPRSLSNLKGQGPTPVQDPPL
ncbi:hypothetical protein HYC85_027809 [Camellia sinensis]|uniref:GRF-type domain-containing protein n=1 Tax=Camellia sinensis TaxID=4442 RepID=A0A7J7FVE3_CAMSI|nr:hypothetical protein HYC85_027809 [Camellia sinensis]